VDEDLIVPTYSNLFCGPLNGSKWGKSTMENLGHSLSSTLCGQSFAFFKFHFDTFHIILASDNNLQPTSDHKRNGHDDSYEEPAATSLFDSSSK
jgi:hypothetical protein